MQTEMCVRVCVRLRSGSSVLASTVSPSDVGFVTTVFAAKGLLSLLRSLGLDPALSDIEEAFAPLLQSTGSQQQVSENLKLPFC